MGKKEAYKEKNELFLQQLATEPGIETLPCGILYKVVKKGKGDLKPLLRNIVSVYYKGSLINGKVFDNTLNQGYPEAFRLNQVIQGWQIALQRMCVGDHWIIYIPYQMGYGTRPSGPIPAFSTLVFEVKLAGIG